MKIAERYFDDDGKLIVQKTYDPNPVLRSTQHLREQGVTGTSAFSDSRFVGRVPGWLVTQWLREAGVSWSDTEARQAVIRKKLLSDEFQKFRVWEGRF